MRNILVILTNISIFGDADHVFIVGRPIYLYYKKVLNERAFYIDRC